MTFLNPFVLFGLVAAGVPILIHLLQLRKLRTVEFSSIRFLKEIQHASVRRVRLRDFLLLLLRSLAIVSLVIAFARPALKGIGVKGSKTAAILIVDDSPSTSARNENGEIFSQLKNTTASLISTFNVGDNVDLIFLSQLGASMKEGATGSFSTVTPSSLLPLVARAEVSNVRNSYSSAIEAAISKLQSLFYVNKEIYFLGDMQRSEFEMQKQSNQAVGANANVGKSNVRLFFIGTNETINDNLSVTNVRIADPVVEVNEPSAVQATLVNNGGTDKSRVVASLYLDGKKVAQSVSDLPAGDSRAVDLVFSVSEGGYHDGVVEIDDNSIQSDNNYNFSFFAIKKLKVELIASKQDNDFVVNAVGAAVDTSTSIEWKIVKPDQFSYSSLSNVDVVIAEDYSSSQTFEGKLLQFARNGGGVILFAPPASELSEFSAILKATNNGGILGSFSSTRGNFLSIERIDAGDDFFSGIFSSKESAEQIKNQLVTKISNMVEVEPNPFSHILMNTSSGPFLMSRETGVGFVFVIASPPDSGSSNFPLSPFFPVVVQRALFYSAAVSHKPIQIFAGEQADYTYTQGGIKNASLISPDKSRSPVLPNYVGGTAKFVLHGLDQLGTYSLSNEDTFCKISVNIDPRESNPSAASRTQVVNFAKQMGFNGENVFYVDAGKNTQSNLEKLKRGQDLSSLFAGLALLFLVAEIFVSKMRTFSEKGAKASSSIVDNERRGT